MRSRHQLPPAPHRCGCCAAPALPGLIYSHDAAGRLQLVEVLLEMSAFRLAHVPPSHATADVLLERGLVCAGLDPRTGHQVVVPLWSPETTDVLRGARWRSADLHLHLLHVCPAVPAAWASTSTPTDAVAPATATDRTATPR